jgi:hypothetical protein
MVLSYARITQVVHYLFPASEPYNLTCLYLHAMLATIKIMSILAGGIGWGNRDQLAT